MASRHRRSIRQANLIGAVFRRILAEPLIQFAALAALIFALYGAVATRDVAPADDQIVVTSGRISQMVAVFTATWQRPPTDEELKGLTDGYVTQEIYVREALALGLDKDDEVIRRRLQQKMEFLNESGQALAPPTDAELQQFLDAHPELFTTGVLTGFEQVFVDPQAHGDKSAEAVAALLSELTVSPDADPARLGDPTLLPPVMPPSTSAAITEQFGPEFADSLAALPVGVWSGPIGSTYGLHVVKITDKSTSGVPALAEVRDAVLREFENARSKAAAKARLDALLQRYQVTVEPWTPPATAP